MAGTKPTAWLQPNRLVMPSLMNHTTTRKGQSRLLKIALIAGVAGVAIANPLNMNVNGITGMFYGPPVENVNVGEPIIAQKLDVDGWTVNTTVPVENPNTVPAELEKIKYKVFIDGNKVNSKTIKGFGEWEIKSNRTVKQKLTSDGDWLGSLMAGFSSFQNSIQGERTRIEIEGKVVTRIRGRKFVETFSKEKIV